MAALDFSKNRFSVTNSSSTSTKAHPCVRMGLFSSFGHSYVNAVPLLIEMMGSGVTINLNGTRQGRPSHGKMNFGMFGSGRLTTSNYIYPSGFSPKVVFVM